MYLLCVAFRMFDVACHLTNFQRLTPFHKEIAAIKADATSGSLAILERTQNAVLYLLQIDELDAAQKQLTILQSIEELLSVHGQLMVLQHFAAELKSAVAEAGQGAEFGQQMYLFIEGYQRQWAESELKIAGQFVQAAAPNAKTILLHSQSTTICRLFDYLAETNVQAQVIQTESRPRLEGRLQAAHIAHLGFPVTVIPDAAVQHAAEWAEMAIVGADAVLRDRFINKIGTYAIAQACNAFHVPLFVLADSRKFLRSNEWPGEQERPPAELWRDAPANIAIWNRYFEPIPNRFVAGFITEQSKIFPLGSEDF